MSIIISQLSYLHPDRTVLFENLNLSLAKGKKASLIGNNGTGKSTLLKVIHQDLQLSSGFVSCSAPPFLVPQHTGQFDAFSIAEMLKINEKIKALRAIESGDISESHYDILNDEWDVEERAEAALNLWGLGHIGLNSTMKNLSGGEKTKVFLAGIEMQKPEVVLMDEPTNHLDLKSRKILYRLIQSSPATMLITSHDRTLLNLLDETFELDRSGIHAFGGNYDFYKEQKDLQLNALQNQLNEQQKSLKSAKKIAQESLERRQKQDSRGEKQNIKKGIPRIAMHNLKDQAEKNTSKLRDIHDEKITKIKESIQELREQAPDQSLLKIKLETTNLHQGKILVEADQINFAYQTKNLWNTPLSFLLKSGDRVSIKGDNGSGKTTLLKLITGELKPTEGVLKRADFSWIYLDQEYSLIDSELTVFEQVSLYNKQNLEEHELKRELSHFLFSQPSWDKKGSQLSGGEKMRLMFCCLMVGNVATDLFILDEPTNNIDIRSLEIITRAVQTFKGTLVVISHDVEFLKEIGVFTSVELS